MLTLPRHSVRAEQEWSWFRLGTVACIAQRDRANKNHNLAI